MGIKDRILADLLVATREGRADVTFYLDRTEVDISQWEPQRAHGKDGKGGEELRHPDVAELTNWAGVDSGGCSFDIEVISRDLPTVPVIGIPGKAQGQVKWKVIEFARLQVSSIRKGRAWSVTARVKYDDRDGPGETGKVAPESTRRPLETAWEQAYPKAPDIGADSKFLTTFGMTCEVMDQVLDLGPEDAGLVLVSGQTGSGKSELLRGLMHLYIQRAVKKQQDEPPSERRNPHVVTFEDPIEALLFKGARSGDHTDGNVDYTPRVKGVDARDLKEVINGALRQKPALLFVGEIRDDEDIKRCLEFAGTGHLVFATTHAGSLLEGVQRALNACKAHDPGTRAIWVPKLRAVIHLKPYDFPCHRLPGSTKRVLLPAMYVDSALAQHALVADGLAALLPSAPAIPTGTRLPAAVVDNLKGALGRRFFVPRLRDLLLDLSAKAATHQADVQKQLEAVAPSDGTAHAEGIRRKTLEKLEKQKRAWAEFGALGEELKADWECNLAAGNRAGMGSAYVSLEAAAIDADLNGD